MSHSVSDAQTKVCPQCAEEVKAAARICRFCGCKFVPLAVGTDPARPTLSPTDPDASPVAGTAPAVPPAHRGAKAPWLIAVGVGAVVIVVAAVMASGTLAAKHTISGTLAIPPADASQNLDWLVGVGDGKGGVKPGGPCMTKGVYSDIEVGTGVTIRDDTDKVVGSASLASGTLAFDKAPECIFRFTLNGVPDAKFYTIEVGGRGKLAFSAESLKATNWSAALSLGGAQ